MTGEFSKGGPEKITWPARSCLDATFYKAADALFPATRPKVMPDPMHAPPG